MSFDFSTVKKQTTNFSQVNKILQKSYNSIRSAEKTIKIDVESCFTLSYEAMLKTTLALMLSQGFRPRVQLGHHVTLVNFSKHILGHKFSSITSTYNKMRQKRNKLIYDIDSVSRTEANLSLSTAKKYFKLVEEKISSDNPQQKLWKP